MTNLRTDETAFFRSLTKIGTDENKGIYSNLIYTQDFFFQSIFVTYTILDPASIMCDVKDRIGHSGFLIQLVSIMVKMTLLKERQICCL